MTKKIDEGPIVMRTMPLIDFGAWAASQRTEHAHCEVSWLTRAELEAMYPSARIDPQPAAGGEDGPVRREFRL